MIKEAGNQGKKTKLSCLCQGLARRKRKGRGASTRFFQKILSRKIWWAFISADY